jgi:hypothetical protein
MKKKFLKICFNMKYEKAVNHYFTAFYIKENRVVALIIIEQLNCNISCSPTYAITKLFKNKNSFYYFLMVVSN